MTAKTKTTWRTVRLGEIARVVPGYAFKSGDFTSRGIPVLRIQNVRDSTVSVQDTAFLPSELLEELPNYQVRRGDILVAMTANLGCVSLVREDGEFLLNQRVAKLDINKERAERLFVFYALLHPRAKHQLVGRGHGSVQANISSSDIELVEIMIPADLSEQKRIAGVLSAFDEKIENNDRIVKALEEMAQAIFKEWFVNFRFPGHEKAEFVDSPQGRIPKGWEIKKLGDVVELTYGKSLREQDRKTGVVVVVGSSGIVGTHDEKLVAGPGVVVGRKGVAGNVIWVDQDFYPIDTTFYIKTGLPLIFCFLMLKRQNFIAGDSAVPGLNREDACRNIVLLPRSELIEQFQRVVESMFNRRYQLQMENQKLAALRDLLLPKLMSGEVRV